MLPKAKKAKIVRRLRSVAAATRGAPLRDRSLFGHLDAFRGELAKAPAGLDYNDLSFEEKQVALALIEAGEAKFSESAAGRTLIAPHSPSLIKRFLSMGAYA